MWKNFDGTARTREETAARIKALKWADWKPQGITIHNTAMPTLAMWAESGTKHDQRIANLESFYENEQGWHAGPHFFVSRGTEGGKGINWFSNPLLPGVHSRCWNATRFGIEMVGDFDKEEFNSGDGAMVRDNAVFLAACLCRRFGFDPGDTTFHRDCKLDNHACPGRKVIGAAFIALVRAEVARQNAAEGAPVAQTPPPAPATPPAPQIAPAASPARIAGLLPVTVAAIVAAAAAHPLIRHTWHNGQAPRGYTKGMAVAFGSAYARLKAISPAVAIMASAEGSAAVDALAWYRSQFGALGMSNTTPGADPLRHLFALMMDHGMRESSGEYNEGRDASAGDETADEAEAGLFQQSWNFRRATPVLPAMFAAERSLPDDPDQNLRNIFKEGVPDRHPGDVGSGDGAVFQHLCKTRPLFAVMTAAVGLRTIGGNATGGGHWGPINRRAVQISTEADDLFKKVQAIVDAEGAIA